jgi:hypothetical protein
VADNSAAASIQSDSPERKSMHPITKINTYPDGYGIVEPFMLKVSQKSQLKFEPQRPVVYNVADNWAAKHDKLPIVCVSHFKNWQDGDDIFWAVRVSVHFNGDVLYTQFVESPGETEIPYPDDPSRTLVTAAPPDTKALEQTIDDAVLFMQNLEHLDLPDVTDDLSDMAVDLKAFVADIEDIIAQGLPIHDETDLQAIKNNLEGAANKMATIAERDTKRLLYGDSE